MPERPKAPRRFRPSTSLESVDTGFVGYFSKCITGKAHHWGAARVFDEVKEGGVVVGHVSILECPTCFKKVRVPLSA